MGNDHRAYQLRSHNEKNRHDRHADVATDELKQLCDFIMQLAKTKGRNDILKLVTKLFHRIEQTGLAAPDIEKKKIWLQNFKEQLTK